MDKIDKIKYELKQIYKNLTTKKQEPENDLSQSKAKLSDKGEAKAIAETRITASRDVTEGKPSLFAGVPDMSLDKQSPTIEKEVASLSTDGEGSEGPLKEDQVMAEEVTGTVSPDNQQTLNEETVVTESEESQREEAPERLLNKKQILLLAGLSLVLVALLASVTLPMLRNNIITKETQSLVGNQFKGNEQVMVLPYNGMEEAISKNESLTVLILDQNDKNLPALQKLLSDDKQVKKMEAPLYVYPLVNEKDHVADYFKVKEGLTLIHFENKKETARKTLTDKEEMTDYLFDYLQALSEGKPAMTAPELEKVKAKANKEENGIKQPNKNSEVIDELKDIII